jgi:signal transduction histidine kinase
LDIEPRVAIGLLAVAIIPLVFVGVLSFHNTEQVLVQDTLNDLDAIASIQEARVTQVIERNLERVMLVSSRTQLRISLDSYIRDGNVEDKEKMQLILNDAKASIPDFKEIFILDLNGQVVVSTKEELENTSFNSEGFFTAGKERHCLDILLDENDNPCICLSGPLELEGQLLGVVVVTAQTESIDEITGNYEGLGQTGETVLAKRNEYGDIVYATSLRFDSDAALKKKVGLDQVDVATTQAMLGTEGKFENLIDYRGEPVFAATRYIPLQDWGIVVKIDRAEALAPINNLGNTCLIIGLAAIVLVACLASVYLIQTKQLQNKLLRSKRMAAIGEAAAMVGHDLRNPLQAMMNALYIVDQMLDPASKKDSIITDMREMVKYMDKIVSDLQHYSTQEKPGLTTSDIGKLIDDSLSTITTPGNVKVSVQLEDDFPKVLVDPHMMKRVFANLAINAIQAMPEGGQLTIKGLKEKDSVSVSFQDTGVGIPEKNLAEIFRPLFTTKAQGQGLGLAVCKRLVELHNGTIEVDSIVGKGSKFTIKIPFNPTET